MAFSHDITFCAGELVDCPKKESCYRYKEVDRFQPGEVFSMATLYKAACCEANDFQLFIGDNNEMCEERTIWVYIFNKTKSRRSFENIWA